MIARLRERLREVEGARRPEREERLSTGCEALDRHLPGGGFARGCFVEWLTIHRGEEFAGGGAGTLALNAAKRACGESRALVVIDGREAFYPPAAALLGIDPRRAILARPANAQEELWALDQALRSPGVGAVLAWIGRLSSRAARRLQLAAESSGGLGFLIRPETARREPCWAAVRLLVRPAPWRGAPEAEKPAESSLLGEPKSARVADRRWVPPGGIVSNAGVVRRVSVEVLHARGAAAGEAMKNPLELEIDHETGVVRVAPSRAAAPSRRHLGA